MLSLLTHRINRYLAIAFFVVGPLLTAYALIPSTQDVVGLFSLDQYDQQVATWINEQDPQFNKPLLNQVTQQRHMAIFFNHYFGKFSPWNAEYINLILTQPVPIDLKTEQEHFISDFSNEEKLEDKIGFGENFRPYPAEWIKKIEQNMHLSQLDGLSYQSSNRGIAIDNLHARILPTQDVYFYHHKIAGEGYPFDNMQMSALWVGTPVYIIGETLDHAWMLVVTPDYIAWVSSRGIARADEHFVNVWSKVAQNKLAAITNTKTSIVSEEGNFLFTAYVGAVFPAKEAADGLQLLVPVADVDHHAVVKHVFVSSAHAVTMPFAATPHHFAHIMNTLIGRPYGWGGMYFYNDCSAELKSLLTPFGIWLPRHSADQVTVGKKVDMTYASPQKRIDYLMREGQRFLTLVYIGRHVMLYVGNYAYPNHGIVPLTYQNVWGLKPSAADRRAIIGQSVFFPMLLQYPEDTSLTSMADAKYFQLSFLNVLPHAELPLKSPPIPIRSMMEPQ